MIKTSMEKLKNLFYRVSSKLLSINIIILLLRKNYNIFVGGSIYSKANVTALRECQGW